MDHAKSDCDFRIQKGLPRCPSPDPIPELRNFEAQLSAALKVNPDCRQPIVLTTDPTGVDRSIYDRKVPAWWVFLDFSPVELVPGQLVERFKLVRSADPGRSGGEDGQGNPTELAREICEFIQRPPVD